MTNSTTPPRQLHDFETMEPDEQRAAIASATTWQNYNGVAFTGALTVSPVEGENGSITWRVMLEGIPLDRLIERAFGPGVARVDCDPQREESYYGDPYQAYGAFLVSFERIGIPTSIAGISPEESQRRRVAWLDAHPEEKARQEEFARAAHALHTEARSSLATGLRRAIDRSFEAKVKLGTRIEIPCLANIGIQSTDDFNAERDDRLAYAREQAELQRRVLEDQEIADDA